MFGLWHHMGAEARALWIIFMYCTLMAVPHNTATFADTFSDIQLVNTLYNRCSFLMFRLHVSFNIV